MTIVEEAVVIEREKLTVKENTEVFTILFGGESGKELLRIGNIYPYEMDKLYPSSYGDYDSDHVWIDINGANFVIRKKDLL